MCDLGPFMIIYHGLHWHSFILSPVSEKELLSNEWPGCSYVHIWRIKQIFFDSFFCFRKSSSHFYANESEGIMDSDEPPTKRPRSDSPPTEKGEKKSFCSGCRQSFASPHALSFHRKSRLNKRRIDGEDFDKKSQMLVCPFDSCCVTTNSYQDMGTHLAAGGHGSMRSLLLQKKVKKLTMYCIQVRCMLSQEGLKMEGEGQAWPVLLAWKFSVQSVTSTPM